MFLGMWFDKVIITKSNGYIMTSCGSSDNRCRLTCIDRGTDEVVENPTLAMIIWAHYQRNLSTRISSCPQKIPSS